ncbi:MAG: CHASE domain-containing protein, partial [Betaproteobacteria bacterium]
MSNAQRPLTVAVIALACGLAMTLFAWWGAARQARNEAQAEFAKQAFAGASVVERRIQRYIDVLYGVEALASHDDELTRREFHYFVEGLRIQQRLPGVQAIQFVRRVPADRLALFEQSVRRDPSLGLAGFPDFKVTPAGPRDEYWVIDFLEPMGGNEAVFGLDVRTRDSATAAERSRDLGAPVMTGRYRLLQETGSGTGLVIYLPVFSREQPRDRAGRRNEFLGFVNLVLRVDEMLAGVMSDPAAVGLGMRIHDVGAVGEPAAPLTSETLFYLTPGTPQATPSDGWLRWRPVQSRLLPIAERQWVLEFEGKPELSPWLQPLPVIVLLAGLALSLLLFTMLRALARARSDAIALAGKATGELRSQLSFTQQLIEAIPNPVFYKDTHGRYLGCNQAFEKYMGFPRDEVIGKTVFDLAPTDTADRSQLYDAALLEQPGAQMYEAHVANTRDGSHRDVLFNKATFYDASGTVAGLVGVIVDITQRKQLEAETREINERLRAVIQAAPMAIVARDLSNVVRMWNPAAERMYGWTEAEVLNTRTSIVPVDLKEETRKLRELAEGGETIWIEETQRQRRDGRMIDVSVSIAPVYGADGQVTG